MGWTIKTLGYLKFILWQGVCSVGQAVYFSSLNALYLGTVALYYSMLRDVSSLARNINRIVGI